MMTYRRIDMSLLAILLFAGTMGCLYGQRCEAGRFTPGLASCLQVRAYPARRPLRQFFDKKALPVEFEASARARLVLRKTGLIRTTEEDAAVAQVLRAAAWTYVAAFITSLTYFLLHLMPLLGGRRG
jgi:hypothetical protein